MGTEKLLEAQELLTMAYQAHKKNPKDKLVNAALAKAFEVAFQYIWKYFKEQSSKAGYEIYSPRDAIKAALEMKLIFDAEQWNTYLSHRNLSVHDYVGIDCKETPQVVELFLKDLKNLKF